MKKVNWKTFIIGRKGFEGIIGVKDTMRMKRGLPRLTDEEIEQERSRVDQNNAKIRAIIKGKESKSSKMKCSPKY